jgi:hypothetical protein
MCCVVSFYIDAVTTCELTIGPNPTIMSYNASAVKIYNFTSSLVRFESKIIFLYLHAFKKTLNPLHMYLQR